MSYSPESAEEAIRHNAAHLVEHGPSLSKAYKTYVLARRPSSGEILLGGLGAMGIGQMWIGERKYHQQYPGYDDAHIVN